MAKTKAELEAENKIFREALTKGTAFVGCTFSVTPPSELCEAVKQIAIALQYAASALNPHQAPLVSIGDGEGGDEETA